MLTILIFCGLVLVPLYYFVVYKSTKQKCLEKFATPPHYPILGAIPHFLGAEKKDILPMISDWAKEYGDFRLWSPIVSKIMVSETASVEKILSSPTNMNKGFDYAYFRPWLGDGLLLSNGAKWGQRRKMLTPAFHFKILEDFMPVFNKESAKLVTIMKRECTHGETFDVHAYITRCALDIICETAMGIRLNTQNHENSEYIQAIEEFGRIFHYRRFRPWLRLDSFWRLSPMYRKHQETLRVLHGFTNEVIKERKIEKQQLKNSKENPGLSKLVGESNDEKESIYFRSKKRRLAFLDLLLQVQSDNGESELSDRDIREETDNFMFEGHETTAASASFTIFVLGCYPEIQKKLQEELDAIFGDEREREITTEDLTKMKYLECVIKESLRLYPIVPFIQRDITSEVKLSRGRTIPSGVPVSVLIYQLHRDPQKFPEPDVFRPERFLLKLDDDETRNRDPYAFIPFSAGPRNCIGQKFAMMEEKVMIASLMRSFNVESMLGPNDLPLVAEITLKSEIGIPVQMTCR